VSEAVADLAGATALSLRDRGFVTGYRALRRVARALPERTGRAVFMGAGSLAHRALRGRRATVAANQAQVLGRPVDDPLVAASTREAFRLYARYWFDTFNVTRLDDDEVLARVRCDTTHRLDRAEAEGRGAILALPHMGNWDVAGRWMAALGKPVVSVAEELRPAALFELFLEHRAELRMDIIGLTRASGVGRQLTQALQEGRFVALVADRDLTERGVEVTMFGRPRKIPTGPALLSVTTGAPLMVCPVFTTDTGWAIRIGEPIAIGSTGDRRADVTALAHRAAAEFERAISEAPADWHLFQPGWA
jgi:phosphatidylinositol dimannoside acyltransferase